MHGIKVIDFHSHFPTSSWYGRSDWRKRMVDKYGEERLQILIQNSRKYRNDWRKRMGFEQPESEFHTDEEQAARWVADMDLKGIELVNFVSGGGNENLAKIIKLYPGRFTGFAHHDLFDDEAPCKLEKAVKYLGLKGYKVIASSQNRPIDEKSAYPTWEAAEKLNVPVLIHFGVLGGGGGPSRDLRNMNPLTYWEVATMFPKLNIVVPHFGSGYFRELLQLCWSCPNVHIDTSGSNQWMRWMPYEIDIEMLFHKVVETVGPDRIIFATDSSYFPRGFCDLYLREQLKACRSIGLDEKSIKKIFYGNAAKLLKI